MTLMLRCFCRKIRLVKQFYMVFMVAGIMSIMILIQSFCKPIRCPETLSFISGNGRNVSIIQKLVERSPEQVEVFQASPFKVIKPRSCWPHRHIFFLKTHKTGSSTIMNMLFRFGESRNLMFALPTNNFSQFFYPYHFRAYFVEGFVTRIRPSYDIMCHHMRFHLTEVEKVMPEDTFYFTIMRNPVSHMESSFSYYKSLDVFVNASSLEEYVTNPHKYYNQTSIDSCYGKNLMAFDLGLDHNDPATPKHFELARKTIETMFNLVLITEYFDESLILLKDALCWRFNDILSFPLNSRGNDSRNVLSEKTQEKIKTWNQLDWQLYGYFNKTFWEKVDTFGRDRMKSEVQELRRRRAEQSEVCLQGHVDPNKIRDKFLKPFQPGVSRILGYNLKPGLRRAQQLLCRRMVTPELQYTAVLYNKQYQQTKMKGFKKTRWRGLIRNQKSRQRQWAP
ncbi:galactose-3-O-sulfotransferase 2-like [Dendropsophus ebraccatus]|uniref:galactose-3-O-sulfotransferase 2-like n=1 Tax=Dendropsophus ebraccatus TaxID=150705 RepID=UPI0038315190